MDWKVPYFGVAREFAANRDAIMSRVEAVYASGQVLQGPDVKGLEQDVAAECGRKHAVAVGSCTDALFFALAASGVGPGDEVLVPDFSFVASASCILRAGAVPVFVDIGEDGNMDLEKAAALVSPRTKAMIYVHLYGLMGKPAEIEAFAADRSLALVEDAAQAPGARRDGRVAGSMGTISCLSFDPTKPLSAPGSGGMALTDDDDLAARLTGLRYHGRNGEGRFASLGYNSQMPSATAAILRFKHSQDQAWGDRRRTIAARYIDGLGGTDCVLPVEPEGARHVYHKFVLQHSRRDAIKQALGEQGIQCMIHYGCALHEHPLFAGCGDNVHSPAAEALSARALSLPCHPFLEDGEIDAVIEAVLEVV